MRMWHYIQFLRDISCETRGHAQSCLFRICCTSYTGEGSAVPHSFAEVFVGAGGVCLAAADNVSILMKGKRDVEKEFSFRNPHACVCSAAAALSHVEVRISCCSALSLRPADLIIYPSLHFARYFFHCQEIDLPATMTTRALHRGACQS